jgi:hypothetical protein
LLQGAGTLEFLAAWTATEVVAKILGVPVMTWVKAHGLVACPPRRAMRHAHGGTLLALRNAVLPRYEAVITLGYTVRTNSNQPGLPWQKNPSPNPRRRGAASPATPS